MSGANNIPLGHRAGSGSMAAAASSFSGISLLNPSYLGGGGPPGPPPESSGSGRRSKFGPPVEGIGPPPVVNDFSMPPGLMGGGSGEPERKRPNMDLINSINASILGKSQASSGMASNSAESREERRRKRKSRWGGDESTEKTFIPGMPTMMPQGLSKDQEEAYLHHLRQNRFIHLMESD